MQPGAKGYKARSTCIDNFTIREGSLSRRDVRYRVWGLGRVGITTSQGTCLPQIPEPSPGMGIQALHAMTSAVLALSPLET